MKKLLALCLGFVPCAVLAATNKIGMVTYFPVSYVAYSQVNAGQMDVGLTSTCDMKLGCDAASKLGCDAASSPALQAKTVKLESGRLDLNGGRGIQGNELSLGSGTGMGKISFQNVRIQTGTMESVNANDVKAAELKLFDKKFPSCKDANTASNGQMSWKSLKLSGATKNELYLACGDMGTASGTCQPTDSRGATYTENCPSGQNGKITYTWDTVTCRYLKINTCNFKKRCLTKISSCAGHDIASGSLNAGQKCSSIESENRECYMYKNGQWTGMWYNHILPQEVTSNYKLISETGCTPGTECYTCEPGQKYIASNMAPGHCCIDSTYMYGPGSVRTLYVIPYAMCGEMSDCSAGTEVSCTSWKDTGSTGPQPFLPSTPDLAI